MRNDGRREARAVRIVVLGSLLVSCAAAAHAAVAGGTPARRGGPRITPALHPSVARLAAAGRLQFRARLGAHVRYLPSPGVDWQVNGVSGGNTSMGTISATGLYVAPAAAVTVTVAAVSRVNPGIRAEASVTVLPPHRIGVRPGGSDFAEFFDRTTGDAFTPRGNTYTRLGYLNRADGQLEYYDSDQPPLSWTTGEITTANGGTYDMASPASRQLMMDDGLVYFTDQVRAAIVAVDPTALVAVGFFWPQTPNPARAGDPRWIEPYPAIAASTADFVDIHGYAIPGELTPAQLIENFKLAGHQQEKPVLMGEFGAFKSSYPSITVAASVLSDWMAETCARQVKGWLLWTWDTEEPEQVPPLWAAMSGDGSINRALAPVYRPGPCP